LINTLQVQSPVPEQVKLIEFRHWRGLQHWPVDVQACPFPVQVLFWHVPVDDPGGIKHAFPVQQSAVLVHTEPCG